MASTTAAVVTVVVLAIWHLRTRRHPNWFHGKDGRFYITLGYPAVAIAVYWLVEATRSTDWAWALGNLWALAAMTFFVYGFNALNGDTSEHTSREPEVNLANSGCRGTSASGAPLPTRECPQTMSTVGEGMSRGIEQGLKNGRPQRSQGGHSQDGECNASRMLTESDAAPSASTSRLKPQPQK
jgi:hypothetical protein